MKRHYVKMEKELRQLCSVDKEKLDNLKRELDKWYTIKCKGAYVRSREKWLVQG